MVSFDCDQFTTITLSPNFGWFTIRDLCSDGKYKIFECARRNIFVDIRSDTKTYMINAVFA